MKVDFDKFNDELAKSIKPKMSFSKDIDLNLYKKQLREKFIEIFCIDKIKENACELSVDIEYEEEKEDYTLTRFTVETEKFNYVPCYLLIPKTGKDKYPLAITIQGHTSGMHISLGINKFPGDEKNTSSSDFAIQAIKNGFAALAIEMRGRGELKAMYEKRQWENGGACKFPTQCAMLMGRTLEGERIWDVSKVIDVLPRFKKLDLDNIIMTGNSGGGTLTYYTACYDERIKLCAPACSFCPYLESILNVYHCICNYNPKAYEYFDMQDLAALIAPRKLLIMSGLKDIIFPIDGVKRGFKTVQEIYEKANAKEYCDLLVMPEGHYWCSDLTWPKIKEMYTK